MKVVIGDIVTRRQAIKTTALLTLGLGRIPGAFAQTPTGVWNALFRGEIPFKLPPLPYALDALEPQIDARALEIHYGKIHANYVMQLNKAIAREEQMFLKWWSQGFPGDKTAKADAWLKAMLKNLNSVPGKIRDAVRENGGGHYNHSLFWQMMKKDGGGEPGGVLGDAIVKRFGSFAAFKAEFTQATANLFGSGWVWLTTGSGGLKVEVFANEDTPLAIGREGVLGLDVWEHAYYLQYQNRRSDYVAAWFNVINWDYVAERYAKLAA